MRLKLNPIHAHMKRNESDDISVHPEPGQTKMLSLSFLFIHVGWDINRKYCYISLKSNVHELENPKNNITVVNKINSNCKKTLIFPCAKETN